MRMTIGGDKGGTGGHVPPHPLGPRTPQAPYKSKFKNKIGWIFSKGRWKSYTPSALLRKFTHPNNVHEDHLRLVQPVIYLRRPTETIHPPKQFTRRPRRLGKHKCFRIMKRSVTFSSDRHKRYIISKNKIVLSYSFFFGTMRMTIGGDKGGHGGARATPSSGTTNTPSALLK